MKNSGSFHISAQNREFGYSLNPPWPENFQMKNSGSFIFLRGGSYEYPQSTFLVEIRKLMYTPLNPSYTVLK